MGIRLAMKKELMGLDNSDMLTADDVRKHLAQQVQEDTERGFSVISKFNDTHSQLVSGLKTKQSELVFERHRLFSAPKPPTSVGGYHQIGFACKKYSC
jgi:hypothetical protein